MIAVYSDGEHAHCPLCHELLADLEPVFDGPSGKLIGFRLLLAPGYINAARPIGGLRTYSQHGGSPSARRVPVRFPVVVVDKAAHAVRIGAPIGPNDLEPRTAEWRLRR